MRSLELESEKLYQYTEKCHVIDEYFSGKRRAKELSDAGREAQVSVEGTYSDAEDEHYSNHF